MAGKVLNIKVCSPLKQRSGLTGNYHAICHYSYNLPLWVIKMKILRYILLLIFASSVIITKGQNFESDWINYKLPIGWQIDIEKKVQYLNYADREMVGELNFMFKEDSVIHNVSFIVFEFSQNDTTLTKNLFQFLLIQSCLDFINTKQAFFQSFESNGFYYFLKPCHGCHLNRFKECQDLVNKLDEFTNFKLKKNDMKDMEITLKSISEQMLRLADFEYLEDQVKSKWFGNEPASINKIEENEKRLEIELPEDYKNFLLIANGFHAFNTVEPTFHSVNKIDYLKNIDPELINIWNQTGNVEVGEILERAVIIAGNGEEQLFLLIPPDSKNTNWRYWKFASWIPGEEPYDDLEKYFNEVLDFMKDAD
jgi:cell wall assembly regulator SMI1